jgi:hypothetical protein
VALACAFQGSTPRGASCSVSPNSVTLNGVDPTPFAVNVATTARAAAVPQVGGHRPPLQPGSWARHVMPMLLALLAASMLALNSRRVVAAAFRAASAGLPAGRRGQVPPGATRVPGRSQGSPLRWVPLMATMLAVLLWTACGGGGGRTTPPPTGTPAGTYNLTLTATAGGVSKTSTLTLTVN